MNNAIRTRENLVDTRARTSAATVEVASVASSTSKVGKPAGASTTWWEWLWDVPVGGPKATARRAPPSSASTRQLKSVSYSSQSCT